MEEKNPEQSKIIDYMDKRFEQIEKLITLSLMNDVLFECANDLHMNFSEKIKEIIEDNGFCITKKEVFLDKMTIYLKTERKVGIKEFRELKKLVLNQDKNMILVFEIDRATAIQKRKFVEEKISYHIIGNELFISKDKEVT